MSLGNKLRHSRSGFKREHRVEKQGRCDCPYCGGKHCWWYGYYMRKGFHRALGGAAKLILWVHRRLCRNPVCGRAFSVLPLDVISYQRFFWPDFLRVAAMAESGKSAYGIAAELDMDVGDSVVRRTLGRIGELRHWLERVAKELSMTASQGLEAAAEVVLGCMDWFKFSRRWFHALYPRRIYPEAYQHNSASFPEGAAL